MSSQHILHYENPYDMTQKTRLSVCLSVSLSLSLSVHVYAFMCLSVRPSACLSVTFNLLFALRYHIAFAHTSLFFPIPRVYLPFAAVVWRELQDQIRFCSVHESSNGPGL